MWRHIVNAYDLGEVIASQGETDPKDHPGPAAKHVHDIRSMFRDSLPKFPWPILVLIQYNELMPINDHA
jgi:hypothetical protein